VGYRLVTGVLGGLRAAELRRLFPAETDAQVPAALEDMVGALSFVAPARALVRAMAQVSSPAYLYHFTRVPPDTRMAQYGAFHSAEIMYVFGTLPPTVNGPTDRSLSELMNASWAQFARTGDPNCSGLPQWPAYTAAADQHMQFGDTVQVGSGLQREACDLFDRMRAERGLRWQ